MSQPRDLIAIYRDLARKTDQPLYLGLTEAWMSEGAVWSASAMGVLLAEGIGDTIRISLTPRPNGDRREVVYAACQLLQALGLRSFSPSVTACPGCGRTTSTTFQELAERVEGYVREMMPVWKTQYEGVEEMRPAVMGCVVNGPGESKAANIGISLPGTGEAPQCPIYIDGEHVTTLRGTYDELAAAFQKLVDDYVDASTCEKGIGSADRSPAGRRAPPGFSALPPILPRLIAERPRDAVDVYSFDSNQARELSRFFSGARLESAGSTVDLLELRDPLRAQIEPHARRVEDPIVNGLQVVGACPQKAEPRQLSTLSRLFEIVRNAG